MTSQQIFEKLLDSRGLKTDEQKQAFLDPDYSKLADPLLLPDVKKALRRLKGACQKKQKVVIYGDYDIDGLSATALLLDAFEKFGFFVSYFIPSRFDDGYGLSALAIEKLAAHGAELIITVDCGSLSFEEIAAAKKLGVDVIVTDHHTIGDKLPEAVAVINPKRLDHSYPFRDQAGVGVAFGLVRAMQKAWSTHSTGSARSGLPHLKAGQEKWLLDLVALGTICDIVPLTGENRIMASWGLKVLSQTRRPGLKALMAVANIDPQKLSARSLGFGLGPRLNASGRLETAQLSLDLLTSKDNRSALALAEQLNVMNSARRTEQNKIFEAAKIQAEKYMSDPVLVLHDSSWSHGIIGIVAAKILEKYHKPTFVLQEIGDETKGSARSFGDFSAAEAIIASKKHIIKGGGHHLAAGVTLKTAKISDFRGSLNQHYTSLQLKNQANYFLPHADIEIASFQELDEELVETLAQLEPFGNQNPEPIFQIKNLTVQDIRKMGDKKQHVKLTLQDSQGMSMQMLAFSAPQRFFVLSGSEVTVWTTLGINEWRGSRSVEGKLFNLKLTKDILYDSI